MGDESARPTHVQHVGAGTLTKTTVDYALANEPARHVLQRTIVLSQLGEQMALAWGGMGGVGALGHNPLLLKLALPAPAPPPQPYPGECAPRWRWRNLDDYHAVLATAEAEQALADLTALAEDPASDLEEVVQNFYACFASLTAPWAPPPTEHPAQASPLPPNTEPKRTWLSSHETDAAYDALQALVASAAPDEAVTAARLEFQRLNRQDQRRADHARQFRHVVAMTAEHGREFRRAFGCPSEGYPSLPSETTISHLINLLQAPQPPVAPLPPMSGPPPADTTELTREMGPPEVSAAIMRVQNRRSGGPGGVRMEFVKYAGATAEPLENPCLPVLTAIMRRLHDAPALPPSLATSRLVPIFKKGD